MQSVLLNGESVTPSKVVCIGRNYVDHIKELNNEVPIEPVIFIKPNSAIATDICIHEVDAIHYEAELSFITDGKQFIAAGIGLDLTKRDVQSLLKKKGLPWERAKAFDGAAVFSAFVSIPSRIECLSFELFINGTRVQQANYDLMIYKPQQILQEVNAFMSFSSHDILMTGTPKGVGKIKRGDFFVGRVYDQDKILIEQCWAVE